MSPIKHTFLITGANSGIGLALALTALRSSHHVIGTTRSIARAKSNAPDFESLGGTWLELEVTSPSTTEIINKTVREHNVDVVVNNAGYAAMGAFETFTEDHVRDQMEVNVMGPVRVMWGSIPVFREKRKGTIVNVSSVAGVNPLAACALYSGSKFALEGSCAPL